MDEVYRNQSLAMARRYVLEQLCDWATWDEERDEKLFARLARHCCARLQITESGAAQLVAEVAEQKRGYIQYHQRWAL